MEGFKIRGELAVFRLSLFTFDENFKELDRSIEGMKPSDEPDDSTMFEFGDATSPLLKAASRCLQNFTASAMTLVDQTRSLYREWYEPKGLIPDYQGRVGRRSRPIVASWVRSQ